MSPPSRAAGPEPMTPSPRDASASAKAPSSSPDNEDESPQRTFDIAARLGLDVFGQPDSPSASLMLTRTAETLHGLTQQLADLNGLGESDPALNVRCCCGAKAECPSWAARERWEAKLKLSGEIGQALLQRYEALERKYKRLEHNYELQRKALADSLRHVANLERANNTHMSKFADLTHSYEALEKRYVQAQHSQSLTQQSLSHVRSELAKCRQTANAQTIALAASGGIEQRLAEAERRYEDTRDLQHAESRKLKEQLKWRTMAEDRIADLESQLTASAREIEEIKAARQKDAQELLANAKERLESLHAELSDTFQTSSPSDTPEYQRTLEDLVATNTLLKHDTSELAHTLSQTMDENRALREELEELRSSRPPRSRPLSMEIRPMMSNKGHMRTGSIPATSSERAHARVSSAIVSEANWGHFRRGSMAPSFTSTSTTDGPSLSSPGHGIEYSSFSSPLNGERPISPDLRSSPSVRHRSSISSTGGIPYISNGVPKSKGTRPLTLRSTSDRRTLTRRSMGVNEAINEWPADDGNAGSNDPMSGDEPTSPDTDTFRGLNASKRRTSVLLPRVTSPAGHYDSNSSGNGASPSDKTAESHDADHRRVNRRTLLLLSRSMGVQTDPIEEETAPRPQPGRRPSHNSAPSVATSETPAGHSETSSLLGVSTSDRRDGFSKLRELLEYLSKMLTQLRGVDIPTLNRRLKKQNLPGDVGHLSRSTIANMQNEMGELRHRFRALLEVSDVSRREMSLLLKLLKDVFSDLFELQNVVNAVTIDPKLAKKLRREAFADPDAPPEPASGLGWIAAPITSFFSATQKPADAPKASAVSPSRPSRDRIITPPERTVRAAPKQLASTSATTTHISVEFGSAGPVRRAVPALSQPAASDTGSISNRSVSAPMASGSARVRSRASRSDLMGIFAGAQPSGVSPAVRARVRHASSQYFGPSDRRIFSEPRERLSTIVDAVLDPGEGEEDVIPGDYEPPLLERTLRPRGLSDSSIRSSTLMDGQTTEAGGLGAALGSRLSILSKGLYKIGESALSSSAVDTTSVTASAQSKSTHHLGLGQPRNPPLPSPISVSDSTPVLSIPTTSGSTAVSAAGTSPGTLKRELDDEDEIVVGGVLLHSGSLGVPLVGTLPKDSQWIM